jgi:UDP-glucose 4-epimerase
MKGKKVIVTGGLGFIGSHSVEQLVGDNKVSITDNQSTSKTENVAHLTHDSPLRRQKSEIHRTPSRVCAANDLCH